MSDDDIRDIARARAERVTARRGSDGTGFRIAFARCESPIEQAYCLALFQVPDVLAVAGDFTPALLPLLGTRNRTIAVFAQQPIPPYRADFLLVGTSSLAAEPLFVVIECDGLDYHSTREQKHRDAGRQAALVGTGFRVVRFGGRQIYSQPDFVVEGTISAFAAHGWDRYWARRCVETQSLGRALADLRKMEAEQ